MKRYCFFYLILVMLAVVPASAYGRPNDSKQNNRKAWNVEMQAVKTDYLAKTLDLTAAQKEKFVPLYNGMENEISKANEDARSIVDEVKKKGKAATDADYLRAARAAYEVKGKEAAIEKKYLAKFEMILTPAQLFALKDAEIQFTKELMKKHSSMRKKARKQNKQ